jgi:hypothetical protein
MSLIAIATLAACGARPHYRHDHIGTGYAGRGGVKVDTTGAHRVDWSIATPRAMRLQWTIDCGGVIQAGSAGETFEEYRTRRIAEIRAEREKQKQAISSIGGAVLGTVGATAVADTPDGQARADVAVDGEAVGAAVAEGVVSDDVQLPAGDLGASSYGGTITLTVDNPAVCTMAIAPDVEGEDASGVNGEFRVVHVVDLHAEAAAANARARSGAIEVRGTLQAGLIARGADPELRARLEAQRLAEANARYEAEMRVRAEREAREAAIRAEREAREAAIRAERDRERAARDAERRARAQAEADARWRIEQEREAKVRLELEARLRLEAEVRARVVMTVTATRNAQLAYLVGVCGASEEAYHARIEAEAEARMRAELELRIRLEAQAEARARAEAEAQARADAEARIRAEREAEEIRAYEARVAELERRRTAALRIRGSVIAYLTWLGAVEKPPMPEVPHEDPGEPPMAGATWASGEWVWRGGAWVWLSGGWTIPDDGFSVSVSVDNDPRPVDTGHTIVVEQPDRAPTPEPERPKVRDHRDEPKPQPKPEPERPRVRDHRDDDDKKKEDKKDDERPRVRDHR